MACSCLCSSFFLWGCISVFVDFKTWMELLLGDVLLGKVLMGDLGLVDEVELFCLEGVADELETCAANLDCDVLAGRGVPNV